MDGSKVQPKLTAGLDLGDRYSYLCLIDQENGEVMEEGRLRTSPETFKRRFVSDEASYAHSHRGWNPLTLGKQGARGVWPGGIGGQRKEAEAYLRQQAKD